MGTYAWGKIDAIFDEGASAWGNMALELGMIFLSLNEEILTRLEALGLRRGLIEKKSSPNLADDVPSLDFSGWPIYTLESTPDQLVRDFCGALDESKELIPWAKDEPLPMKQIVSDSAEGHIEVPLHPAAERYWRERGYLT